MVNLKNDEIFTGPPTWVLQVVVEPEHCAPLEWLANYHPTIHHLSDDMVMVRP
jgi:hypothetical protein